MANYNNASKKPKNEKTKTAVPTVNNTQTSAPEETQTNTPETEVTIDPVIGYVSNCEKLNIRRDPDTNAEILVVVNKDTKVEIDEDLSTDEFYSVTAYCPNDVTVEGYAMKDFINIK